MGTVRHGLVIVFTALASILGLATPVRAESQVEVIARGLKVPWAIAFTPDGRMLVTERPGRIRVVADGRLHPEPVAVLPVAAVGEGGLMGIAVDPAFAANRHIYVCYTAGTLSGLINRLVRLTLRGPIAEAPRVLLDDMPGAPYHNGCRVKFGPDGKLYVTMGDAVKPGLAQRRDSLSGKILRLNPDGSVPTDNPFPGSPVYSLGHRNPQGLAWDSSGRLFAAEHGPGGHDEVNLILPGRNYGWPEVSGRGGNGRFVEPVLESGKERWAPSGIAFHGTDLFIALLRGERLLRVTFEADGKIGRVMPLLDGTHGRLREVVAGPDGALYVTTSNRDGRGEPAPDDDRILRVSP